MQFPRIRYDVQTLRGDLSGGITAAVVSLPFALAFGEASGMGAAAGLYGSLAVGFLAAAFGGSRTVISGPAPSVTIAMAVIVASHAANLAEALTVVVMGGLLQVLLGLSGIGRFVVYTPHVVISGIMSGILRAAVLLALLLGLGGFVEPIPHAVLAAILMKVGWGLVDWRLLARARHHRREHLIVIVTTMVLTVFVDLITAGAIGLIVAGMAHARQLERLEQDSVMSVPLRDRSFFADDNTLARVDSFSARVGLLALKGAFTVASSRRLVDAIGADIKQHEVVIFDFTNTTYLDDSAARLIGQLLDIAGQERTEFVVVGISKEVERTLFAFGVLRRVPEGRRVETMYEARRVARGLLSD